MRSLAAASAVALAVPFLAAAPASADPAVDGTFTVSGVSANNQITLGPDGAMWVTLDTGVKDIARIATDGTVTEYDSANITNPIGIVTGPDNKLYVTQANGIARFSPADPTTAEKFTIADITDARGITVGPDGNLWTASGDKVVKIPPANPAGFTTYAATGVMGARWITSGSDGNLWVADFGGSQVVRVTPAGVGTAYATTGGLQGVAAGPDGQVAYTQQGAAPYYIGRRSATQAEQQTSVPGTDPFGVTLGADGAYWVAEFATNQLGRLTTDGQYSTLALPAGSGPRQISARPGNTLWVTLDTTEQVARISGVSPTTKQPTTYITKKPKHKVRTAKHKARVKFRFVGSPGSTFQCRVDKGTWQACTSPSVYKLARGKHRFAVRAVLDGQSDPTPAKWTFRIRIRQ